MTEERRDDRPWSFKLAGWYGFGFAIVFLLYGGVGIIMSVLDRNYDMMAQHIAFVALGLILITPAIAYKEHKAWGYWGLVGINGLVILGALVGFSEWANWVLAALSGLTLYLLLMPATKRYLFERR